MTCAPESGGNLQLEQMCTLVAVLLGLGTWEAVGFSDLFVFGNNITSYCVMCFFLPIEEQVILREKSLWQHPSYLTGSKILKEYDICRIFSSPIRMFDWICNAWYCDGYQSASGEDFKKQCAAVDDSKVSL